MADCSTYDAEEPRGRPIDRRDHWIVLPRDALESPVDSVILLEAELVVTQRPPTLTSSEGSTR